MRTLLLLLPVALLAAPFEGKVVSVDTAAETARLLADDGKATDARVGPGDLAVGWAGRRVRGDLIESSGRLRLERVFPAEPESLRRMPRCRTPCAATRSSADASSRVGWGTPLPPGCFGIRRVAWWPPRTYAASPS